MALSPQWLDELRARITLSSVIGRTTKLLRAGREWKACCPFHNEKTPSFTVNDEKGFYHCFGCGAHGDVIRWMTDQRGLSFMDAVKELASEAGLEVPQPDPREAKRAEQRAGLHDVMQAAQDWFVNNLAEPRGAAARKYLMERGFDARTIQRFGFGYAPGSRIALLDALGRFDEAMLLEGGLRIAVEGKEPYDRFRDRLMLPIQDARGRVIAFGGRILPSQQPSGNDSAPKYLNSPDTPLFDKGRTLYNLHRAGPASRHSHRIVVVEGYMDVIALAAAGIEDAVAPLGTALTERQIEMLWRLVEVPLLCFDGDTAGQRAAMRAVTRALPLLRPGYSLAIVRLPAGQDPDDLIKAKGSTAMEGLLANPSSLLDTLWEHEREAKPLNTPEDKAGLKARLLEHVEVIEHPDIKALYRRELLDRFSAFAYPPRAPFTPHRKFARPTPERLSGHSAKLLRGLVQGGGRDNLASAVIAGLARFPDQIHRHAEALAAFETTDAETTQAINILLDHAETLENRAAVPIKSLESLATPPDQARRYSFLMEDQNPQSAREDLAEAVAMLVERPAIEAALAAATARFEIDPEGAIAEQQRLRQRKLALEERLRQLARQRVAGSTQEDSSPAAVHPAQGEQGMD
ncbi:DNA primase [Croceicoccus estronivorus]|uniref:DNA primase n=1 Tax=Croceicoccus estronivorus TaxID=1172626 RepID=UPI00082A17A6|nr:DNA primase [Croceicoccus estronivorus]OCC24738.1 DNA primase [Croceicoccus estronivorus]